MKTLIVIPAYNEEHNLPLLINDIKSYNYDYLIINDGSTDNTEIIAKKNNYNILNLPINIGIAGVTRAGFKYAVDNDYDCVVCIDGDGQHQPKYIHSLIKEVEKGYDYVIGSRFVKTKRPFTLRMLGSRILSTLIYIKTKTKIYDPTSGMRAVGKNVIKIFSNSMNFCAEPDTVCFLLRKKLSVKEVQVVMENRVSGKSYFASPLKTIKYMIEVIISILLI